MRLSVLIILSMISIFVIPPVFAAEASLDTIVVTATRTDSDIEKLPSSVTVITGEDISNSTASTVQDVLENVEGLIIRDLYGTGTKSTVDSRGFARGVNTVVLIDGRRINEIDLSGVDWNLIPLENIERIEIVRGGGSVLYGDNATSGVINIITKKGKTETPSIDVQGQMESFSGSSENLSISGRSGKYDYYLFGKTRKTDGYRDNGEFSAKDLTGHVGITPTDSFYLDIEGGTHSDEQGLPGGLTEAQLKADRKQTIDPLDGVDYDQYYYNAVAGFDFKDHYNLELSYGFNTREFDSIFFSCRFGCSPFTTKRDTDRAELKAKFVARRDIAGNKNVFVAGADRYVSTVDNNSASSFGTTISDVEKKETGYYIEDEFSLTKDLTLLAGFRRTVAEFEDTVVDTFSGTGSGEKTIKRNSSHLGLTYNHVPGGKFFVSYSNGFRLPTTDELFSFDGTITLLKPEKTVTYEAGVSHPLSKHTSASLTVYTMNVEDELFYNKPLERNENISVVRHKGAEAGIETNLSKRLKVSVNGTYSKVTRESGQLDGKTMPLVPKYSANLSAIASLTDELKLSANANYVGSSFIENDLTNSQEKLPSRTTVDARLSYGVKNITVFAGVNNLFNKEYSEYAVMNATGTVKYFYPAPERWYYAGIKAAF